MTAFTTFRTSVDVDAFLALEGEPSFRTYALLQGLDGHPTSCHACGGHLNSSGLATWAADRLVVSLWSCLNRSCPQQPTYRVETALVDAEVRDHNCGGTCGSCQDADQALFEQLLAPTVAPLTRREAKANARDPWTCPRCHDTKSSGRDLCRSCEAGLR